MKGDEKMKTFTLTWLDQIKMSINIKAKNKSEAKKMFIDGDVITEDAKEGCRDYVRDSLEVELNEKGE